MIRRERRPGAWLAVAVALAACAHAEEPPRGKEASMSSLPEISQRTEIKAHNGTRVRLIGTYGQRDVRMARRPPAQYKGHVAIELADKSDVFLEAIWTPAALRSVAERKQFENKRVVVVGTLHATAPQPPDGSNSLRDPCMSEIESIALAPEQ